MPFGKITIIGVGLIGSSLARALRGKASEVAGCSRKQETVETAMKLQALDSGTTDFSQAVKGAEIVVLCTPLSVYGAITEAISPYLSQGGVLTDAGSVKHAPSLEVLSHLNQEQKPWFVPGHPIAGTEKSGPEAGFKELFQGKKTLLTPFSFTEKKAIARIKLMWETAGAVVEALDSERHDSIYAIVSHTVQLLSSAYGLLMEEENISEADDNFRVFIRLAGSDPVMWRDIFLYNTENVKTAIAAFLKNLDSFSKSKMLQKRLQEAQEKRRHFQKLRGVMSRKLESSVYTNPKADLYMHLLPRVLACALMESIAESEYEYATSAGLHGFTENLLSPGALDAAVLSERAKELSEAIARFKTQLDVFMTAMESRNAAALENLLRGGRKVYLRLNS